MQTISRLSINQYTVRNWTIPQLLEDCAVEQISFVSLWRDKVAETGLEETMRLLGNTGTRVSSLCRGGFFPAATAAQQFVTWKRINVPLTKRRPWGRSSRFRLWRNRNHDLDRIREMVDEASIVSFRTQRKSA